MNNSEKCFLCLLALGLAALLALQYFRRPALVMEERDISPRPVTDEANTGPGPRYMVRATTPWGFLPPIANVLPHNSTRKGMNICIPPATVH